MNIQRAFTLIHNLDIPEAKRKHWPQWSTVVVNKDGSIEDVIQYFDQPSDQLNRKHMDLYPASVQFTAKAEEMYTAIEDLEKKLKDCIEAHQHY